MLKVVSYHKLIKSRPRENSRHIANIISKVIFFHQKCFMLMQISLDSHLSIPMYLYRKLLSSNSSRAHSRPWVGSVACLTECTSHYTVIGAHFYLQLLHKGVFVSDVVTWYPCAYSNWLGGLNLPHGPKVGLSNCLQKQCETFVMAWTGWHCSLSFVLYIA